MEFGFGINIITLPGLHADLDIDGFISGDLSEILVDLAVFESRPTRYRFTLAHEIGHLVLHGDALKEIQPKSVAEWKRLIPRIPEKDRSWLEWQAYSFGGLVLVPAKPLAAKYQAALRLADEEGIDIAVEGPARQYIATYIGKTFEVSPTVVEKRLVKDGIWERLA